MKAVCRVAMKNAALHFIQVENAVNAIIKYIYIERAVRQYKSIKQMKRYVSGIQFYELTHI